MIEITQQPAAQALAWTLVHFLWQGAVIGLVAFGLVRLARRSASVRYGTGVVALALMLVAPVATFGVLLNGASRVASPSGSFVRAQLDPLPATSGQADATRIALTPAALNSPAAAAGAAPMPAAIIAIWAVGVVILSLRLLGGWIVARRL